MEFSIFKKRLIYDAKNNLIAGDGGNYLTSRRKKKGNGKNNFQIKFKNLKKKLFLAKITITRAYCFPSLPLV